jgi:hypothetical protein
MAFNSNLVNFLTVGNFATDPSYELPLSQQLVTSSAYGLAFANSGSGSTYELQTSGNMLALMTLQQTTSYGVVISVPQIDGGLITRTLTGSSSISISDATGAAGNPTLSVTPSSTVQLVNTNVGGTPIGSARSTLNFIAGTNVGINATDSGTVTNITINATQDPLIGSGPFVITQADASLTGASNLGALATGYVLSTVSAGISTLSTVSALSFATLAATQTFTGVNTFAQPPVMSGASIGASTIPAASVSGTAVTLSGAQTITSIKTFSQPPVMSGASITSATIPAASVSGTAVTLSDVQTITAIKTFTPQQIFTNSIKIPTGASAGNVLTSDASGNASWSSAGAGDAILAATQTFTGIDTFTQPPVMSGASITSGTIPIVSVVGTAMDLTTAQTVAGVKTFSSDPVLSGASITSGTIPIASVVGTAVALSGTQTITAVKTFTPQQIFTNSIQIPLGAVSGYVLTSDASGNMTLAANTGAFSSAAVSTTDATPTTLATAAIASNTAVTFSGTVVGRNTAGTINNACGGRFNVVAVNTAGTVTLAATQDVTVQSTSTATFNVVVSGTNLIVQVTGIAATAYNWSASYTTSAL